MRYLTLGILLLLPFFLRANNLHFRTAENEIELRNKHASLVLSHNAELISFTDLHTNTDIAVKDNKKIAYAKTIDGKVIEATRLYLENSILIIIIGDNKVELRVLVYEDYFTFEVLNTTLDGVDVLTFLDLNLNTHETAKKGFCATGVAMTLQTNPVYYPSCENNKVIGRCATHLGVSGSKLAVIASHTDAFWDIVKDVYRSIPPHTVPIALCSGGPFSNESEANRYDGVIISDAEADPVNVPKWIEFYSKYGINQIGFYFGPMTYIQGDFSFPYLGGVSNFKKQISDPLYSTGKITALHTFSYYISYSSNDILSNPKWQQQLENRGEYILLNEMKIDDASAKVAGDLKRIKNPGSYNSVYSPFILIDEELIRYTMGEDGFVNCNRGQCGTVASPHKKGSVVRVIGGYFNHISPRIGSDLYYEIARRTAYAYNEGGFRGLYFDALDGLGMHLANEGLSDYYWYYGAAFVNEVLKYCKEEPLVVEFSTLYSTIWPARGRGECWDTPNRGYKSFIDKHTTRNKYLMARHYISTLGWYRFYPERPDQPGGFSTKYMFIDDVDYLGVMSIAYDQTMVYDGLIQKNVESNSALRRNLETYTLYSKLRRENYFSDRVKDLLKSRRYEYKLAKRGERWGFYEATYCRSKIRDITIDNLVGANLFKNQKPFIRLENLYTSDCSSSVNLMNFDSLKDVMEQNLEKQFSTPLDLSKNLGIRISLKGNGKSTGDALCIRLLSPDKSAYADYIVRLNFDGWREVILPNLDNAEYPDLKFDEDGDERYKIHRNNVNFTQIKYIQILNSGDCSGVRVERIDAVPLISNVLKKPIITIRNTSVSFLDSIKSGEYLEYNPGDEFALVYSRNGNYRVVNVEDKNFRVPRGKFTAQITGEAEQKNAPTEVVLTFGLYGTFIHN